MATRNLAARGLGSALATGLGLLRGPFARGGRRRRQEELLTELLRQLARMTEEIHRANLIQEHRIAMDLMDRTIDDPSLADARSTLAGVSEAKRRQMIFANRQYGSLLLAYRIGSLDWGELLGHLRVLCRNGLFAEYWDRTAEHRLSLPTDSLERQVGKGVDAILEELAEDPEEWWIVGPPEGEPPG
ncbi:DUF6082 family protein [Streptomyces cupreus]|uniref:Secreted protein n=1 Tax=Streptomyces cupreus TaxID=2759956 RepID=A0A7X1IZ12_9ACTN|nr:DUF6082 family protein [Streptomyces cupreus]MBC2901186.1 hypothetical protein [Streptomyces cupreus]